MMKITTIDVVKKKTDDDIGLWDWLEMKKNRKREMRY